MLISRARISCFVICQTALALGMTGCTGTLSLVLISEVSSALRRLHCILVSSVLSYCSSELLK